MARVRTVFGSHSSLAHTWAQQSFPVGYSSDRRMFFEGETIYSYGRHYAIARFTDLRDTEGRRVVYFREDGYSVSTSKHRSHTRDALHGLNVKVVYVEHVDAPFERNLAALMRAFANAAELLASPLRNRHTDLSDRLVELQNRADTVRDFAALNGNVWNGPFEAEVTAQAERITAAMNAFNDPVKLAKREKDKARRLVQRSLQEGTLHLGEAAEGVELWLKHGKPLETVKPLIVAVQIKRAEYEIELTAKALDPEADKVRQARRMTEYHGSKPVTPEEWQDGIGHASQHSWGYDAPTLVRRKGDRLETSRGAEVPFKHAVAAYLKACECRRNGTTWHRNGEKVAVGVYQLDAIDAEGNIRAGCHTIGFDEMQRLALREVPHLVRATFSVPALIAA